MTAFPAARRITLPERRDARPPRDSISLSVHEAGAGLPVVLCHGFPELAYSWRYQFAPLTAAGFRPIAADGRGYGASDAPEAIEDYDLGFLCGDLDGLLDALGIDRAVFVGHDWGGLVVWAMPCLYPDRVLGVVGVNTPYLPRPPAAPLQILAARAEGDATRHYMLWFQAPGVAEALLDQRVADVFSKLLRRGIPVEEARPSFDPAGDMNPFARLDALEVRGAPVAGPAELAHFTAVFEKTGFRGGINWYRNLDRNWERFPEVGTAAIDVPCLMVTAEWDPVLRPEMALPMRDLCTDLETASIAACGHWTQQEKPDELNRILVDWLRRRFAT